MVWPYGSDCARKLFDNLYQPLIKLIKKHIKPITATLRTRRSTGQYESRLFGCACTMHLFVAVSEFDMHYVFGRHNQLIAPAATIVYKLIILIFPPVNREVPILIIGMFCNHHIRFVRKEGKVVEEDFFVSVVFFV